MRLDNLLRDLICLLRVVLRLNALRVIEELHIRILCHLLRDRTVCPLILRGIRQMCDHRRVDAFAAHRFLQLVHNERTIACIIECLKVIIRVLARGALMRNDNDALVAGLLQYRVTRRRINRDNTEGVDSLVDHILNDLYLLCCIGCRRPLLIGVDPGISSILLHALIHTCKPAVGRVLDDNGNFPVLLLALRRHIRGLDDVRNRLICAALLLSTISATAGERQAAGDAECHRQEFLFHGHDENLLILFRGCRAAAPT